MDKEQILQKFFAQDGDKSLLMEKIVFCRFADKYDFENYFRIEELKESELFCLISFLYHEECYLMMTDIMNKYRERFISHDTSIFEGADFSEEFIARLERMQHEAEGEE